VTALTIGGFLALFVLCNVFTYRTLVRLHPRWKPVVIALTVICNVMWVLLPVIRNTRTDFSRIVRAVFGPPWFAWLSFILLYTAFLIVARRAVFSRIFLWSTLLALPAGVYAALVPLRVEHVPVAVPGGGSARIVELADLHVGLFTRPSRLRKIFATAAAAQPDAIVIAGDLIDDDPYFVPKLLEGVAHVPPHIPIYAVLGNHEMYGAPDDVIARLRGSRIRLLVNEGVAVRRLWLAGISDFAGRTPQLRPNFAVALAGRGARVPVVLSHQPKAFDEARRLNIPLTICAHTHGGQFGFRPLRWSLAGVFLPFHMGLYRRGPSQLYVNTGTGYWLLPWRLGMTPEITVIDVR
jgi:predicted MPP superfamily phosphohydrolase